MIKGYAAFCDADRHFYDAPHRLTGETAATAGTADTAPATAAAAGNTPAGNDRRGAQYAAALAPAPAGWQRHRSGDWLALRPVDSELPAQGWKIHISACLGNAESILARVSGYCQERGIAYKFVPSRYLLHNRNAKYADRAASGKFITVYPADDAQLKATADDLAALLDGEPGPYILSDLRWGAGPVHVRYGSFTRRHCYDEQGELRPAVQRPDGRLVPDLRGPVFQIPDWVEPPAFLTPHLDARTAVTVAELPYTVESALHFSNGGGVYIGRDRATGEKVVLKEARPHAGLAADGADAVTRLRREQTALERLSGLGCTPEVRGTFTVGDHHFLAMEFLEGKPLNTFFARRHPLIEADPSPEALADYTEWALRVYRLVEQAVDAVHGRGVVFNDLHLFNIMVAEDEQSVALLDFEAAAHIDEGRRQTVANPGFVAPADRRGFDVDRYALACLRLALFIPLTSLLPLDLNKARHLADIAAEQFPVDRAFLDEAVAEITRGAPDRADGPYLPVQPGDWPRSRDSLVRAVLASASPEREDRYFPGDIAQFAAAGGGLTFGYGAAGILYALAETGAPRHTDAEEWLLRRTKEPESGTPVGFYDGLAGLAWTLDRLGHPEQALQLAESAQARPWQDIAPDLHSGLAGVGLALDSLAASTGTPALHEAALRCAGLVADAVPGINRAGLLYGASGPALLFIRLYERTGDPALLDRAADALRRDLARCVTSASGTLQVDEGWRTMPYLGAGSVGIGMVLDDYLAHREDPDFERARREIVQAAQATFYAQPGLFRGAAGMVLHLSRTTAPGPGTEEADVRRQIDALARHAVPYRGELAFPGEQMMRLSMDLATGTAGCLLALGSAASHGDVHLPFLPPPKRRPQPGPSQGS
ncbi:lantipeptide synthetase [Streptomyces solincola]|uniref:non-specific serine/threonine protein kinase n=1 Tax=Streptomyces solincola TaxID=2100817 RepID=A0A2S9PS09_9ACTN|nr:class III lanthionine synthetase LanKC [Streptomyces solincola]PRH77208.1 lantipeptide synthetase [Streptomyces solincola]